MEVRDDGALACGDGDVLMACALDDGERNGHCNIVSAYGTVQLVWRQVLLTVVDLCVKCLKCQNV